jgi:FMN reductase
VAAAARAISGRAVRASTSRPARPFHQSPQSLKEAPVNFTVVVGNPRPESRTLGVALAAAEALAETLELPAGPGVVDLSVLARRLLLPEPSAAIEDATDQVLSADLLLVASPAFKGTYSGLLKVFLDRLPYKGLEDTTALPLLVMDSPLHVPAVDVHLRPLLVELGAEVPAPGLAVLESEIGALDRVLHRWTGQVSEAMGRNARERQVALSGRH